MSEIKFEASRPTRGNFVAVDGEGEAQVKFTIDSSQTETIKKLLDLPYGTILKVRILNASS